MIVIICDNNNDSDNNNNSDYNSKIHIHINVSLKTCTSTEDSGAPPHGSLRVRLPHGGPSILTGRDARDVEG